MFLGDLDVLKAVVTTLMLVVALAEDLPAFPPVAGALWVVGVPTTRVAAALELLLITETGELAAGCLAAEQPAINRPVAAIKTPRRRTRTCGTFRSGRNRLQTVSGSGGLACPIAVHPPGC